MIVIRSCEGFDEFEACVQLQIDTWGYDPTDIIPRKTFLLAQKIGGQVISAFDTDLPGAGPRGGHRKRRARGRERTPRRRVPAAHLADRIGHANQHERQ